MKLEMCFHKLSIESFSFSQRFRLENLFRKLFNGIYQPIISKKFHWDAMYER